MVKINKSGYTPITQDTSLTQLEGKIDVATNQANGLVDASLRNVTSTQNQAARDRMQANEDAFRVRIGLSDAYFATKQKYMDAVRLLSKIDEANALKKQESIAAAYNLQAKEKISLLTTQFYETAKRKNPLTLVEDTQEFINSQIEEAVRTAPNDKAVVDLYADMAKFKIERIGDAVKAKAEFHENQIDLATGEAKNIISSKLRLAPTRENYDLSISKFEDISDILRGRGFSDTQILEIKSTYESDITSSFLSGLMDVGDINSIKKELSDENILGALGSKAQGIIKDAKELEAKLIEKHDKELIKARILNLYESGKSPEGIDGAEKIVYEENINVLQSIESQLDKLGPANAATYLEKYLGDRSHYLPTKTLEYISNKALYGSDKEKAMYVAGAVKLLNNPKAASQLSRLSKETKADIMTSAYYLESLGDVSLVKTIMDENSAKLNKLGGEEAINSIKTRAYEDMFGKQSTVLDRGSKLLKELSSSEWLYNSVGDQDIEFLGAKYDQAFREGLIRSNGNATIAHSVAVNLIKLENVVTDVNGYDQVMKNSPTQLGILSTEEGKNAYNTAYNSAINSLATKMSMTVKNDKYITDGNKEIRVDIAPIPFITGNELNGTVNYALVNGLTGESIMVAGKPQYLTINTKAYQDVIDKRNAAKRTERERLLDLSNKAWNSLGQKAAKANKPVMIGK